MSDPGKPYGLLDMFQGKPRPVPTPDPLPDFTFNPFATGPGVTNGMMVALPLSQKTASSTLPPNAALGGPGWPDGIMHKVAPASLAAAPPSDAVTKVLQCMTANGPANFIVTSTSDGHSNPTDPHYQGKAFDVTADPAYRAAIMQAAANCGAVYQQDEYANPSKDARGGHLHFQLRAGKGGAVGPYFPQGNSK